MNKLRALWVRYGTPRNLKVAYILTIMAVMAIAGGAPGAEGGNGGG